MEQQEFLHKLSDLLNLEEELTLDTILDDMEEWDSLSYIMFLAMVLKATGEKIEPERVKAVKTVRELYALV